MIKIEENNNPEKEPENKEPEKTELEKKEPESKESKKLVKCVLCGAVFDASLDTCPICGVGKDKFVPADE